MNCFDPSPPIIKSQKLPLLTTNWHQRNPYNALILDIVDDEPPFASCTPPTGCVATAMAQLIRYWQPVVTFTTPYNYSIMPNNTANIEVQRLMKDCGDKVGMVYGCALSTAYSNTAMYAFANHFGFEHDYAFNPTSIKRDYNNSLSEYNKIKADLNINRPVYLRGCRTRTKKLFRYIYENCHAWLSDGYREEGNNCYTERFLHMNWGWSNSALNSYYFFNNWEVLDDIYLYNLQYYYSIKL